MKFEDSHPEFQSMKNNVVDKLITDHLFEELKMFILGFADTTRRLTVVCVDLAERLTLEPIQTTLDWTLRQAYFEDLFLQLRHKSFTGMMDFLSDFAELYFDAQARERLNTLLLQHHFAYILTLDKQKGAIWETADSVKSIVQPEQHMSTYPYTEKLLNSIEHSVSLVRNVLSGQQMFLVLKSAFQDLEKEILYYTGKTSIDEAFTLLHSDTRLGTQEIIKESQLLYKYLHNVFSAQSSTLGDSEVMYWIERIEILRRYIAEIMKAQ